MTYKITTTGPDATGRLGEAVGRHLRGGETIELVSDLGGGKTTFVQGLARGFGYNGEVRSPTFALSNIYVLDDGRELHHYDLYRLGEAGAVGDELAEDLEDAAIVTVIEWGDVAAHELPVDRLRIEFAPVGENDREIIFRALGSGAAELIRGLAA